MKPIIQELLSSMTPDGTLPRRYHLPDSEVADELRYLPGAEDGVCLYHMKPKDVILQKYTAIIYQIKNGDEEAAQKAFYDVRAEKNEPRMIDVIGPLEEWVAKHPNIMHDEKMIWFAINQIATTDSTDMIKFSLAILSDYQIDPKGQIARMIRTLALYDEFTFQCVILMRNWADGNENIFEVAKRVFGWGRIHAVHYLEPETVIIRDWMVTDGWKNDVRAAYSARDLATKLNLVKMLIDPNLDKAMFDGICGIMDALMDDSPVPGISSLKEKDILMDLFLKHAQGKGLTREGVSAVQKIRRYQDSHAKS